MRNPQSSGLPRSLAAACFCLVVTLLSGAPLPAQTEPARGPFSNLGKDLPRTHPAGATVAYLKEEFGFFGGLNVHTAASLGHISRYEFALAIQRWHGQLAKVMKRWSDGQEGMDAEVVAGGFPDASAEQRRRLIATFSAPRNLVAALTWYQPLLVEFDVELQRLKSDQTGMEHETAAWLADVRKRLPPPPAKPDLSAPPGPFSDVPRGHPAYPIMDYFASDVKLFTGYPLGTFSGSRLRMRYEFAVATARLYVGLDQALRPRQRKSEAGHNLVLALIGPKPRERAIDRIVQEPVRLRRILAWYRPCLWEFHAELLMLGLKDTKPYRANVEIWIREAEERARTERRKADPSGKDTPAAEASSSESA